MNKFDFKGWCTRPILIGAVVGVTVGITYLFINTAEEEGSTSIPINMAQIAESEWENQDAPKKSDVKFEFDATEDDDQSNLDAQSGTAIDPELPKIEQTGAQFEDPEMMEDLP